MRPDYSRIYNDLIREKFPEKLVNFSDLLSKKYLSSLEIIEMNKKLFGSAEEPANKYNQKIHSFNKKDIFQILEIQNKHRYSNSELSRKFKISRNTIAKWKKIYIAIS